MAACAISNKQINDYLNSQNIDHTNLGYTYIMDGIRMFLDDEVERGKVLELYKAIAQKRDTRPEYVERSIRSTIKRVDSKMTNKRFLVLATDNLIYSEY